MTAAGGMFLDGTGCSAEVGVFSRVAAAPGGHQVWMLDATGTRYTATFP